MKVSFQGEPGAYSELAAIKYFGKSVETVPCKTFSDVFKKVENGKTEFGIIPIENSLEGSVGQNYDLLLNSELKIVGEYVLKIVHCLIASPKTKLNDIRKVYSHPQALGQCRKFLEDKEFEQIPVYDTAGSVKILKESGSLDSAGIASEIAAKIYGMKILKKGIETSNNNYTRFFVISKESGKTKGGNKTSLIFSAKHEPGSLFKSLRRFADNKINITKIESRPIHGKVWEYNFYLDFEDNEKTEDAIEQLKRNSTFVKILGSYPKAR